MLYIFEVTMKTGYTVEQYAQAWVEVSRVIQQNPGARGTFLHRKIGEPDTLLAIAHWRCKADRDQKDDSQSALVQRILECHSRHCEFRLVGEYEEPDWQVMPGLPRYEDLPRKQK